MGLCLLKESAEPTKSSRPQTCIPRWYAQICNADLHVYIPAASLMQCELQMAAFLLGPSVFCPGAVRAVRAQGGRTAQPGCQLSSSSMLMQNKASAWEFCMLSVHFGGRALDS
eukprot:1160546-Pelagomonas_calceolata.AAC.3